MKTKNSTDLLSILIIDDDPVFRNLFRAILKQKYNIFVVEKPSVAFNILKTENIDIIFSDFMLPEMNGLEVLEKVKGEYPDIEVIMISDSGDMDTVITALKKGATDYFKKPFTPADIWVSIEKTKKFKELKSKVTKYKKQNEQLRNAANKQFGIDIIGKSKQIETVKSQMELVATTPDTSVLIIGESGTGKELVARGVHNLSSRSSEIFGAVNMSAVPEALFESEFFGHKKGSFTGAISEKAGWFEGTDKGTLFFDEVGEMSMTLQVKLLRVLEDRKFVKVGDQRQQVFDIRIVAATNKSIPELSSGKDFRLDLFHRLGTFIIHLPPLRERKEDIPLLAKYFLKQLNKKLGRNVKKLHPNTIKFLKSYPFPGNIRELRNLMERAVILCTGDTVLPEHVNAYNSHKFVVQSSEIPSNSNFNTFNLQEIEKRTITKALQKVNYSKAEAARLLNIEWNALYRRIQKHGIDLPSK